MSKPWLRTLARVVHRYAPTSERSSCAESLSPSLKSVLRRYAGGIAFSAIVMSSQPLLAQQDSGRHQSYRVSDEGIAVSSQTPSSRVPDLRGTSGPELGVSTFDRDREKLYSELADDFTMLDRMGNLVKRVSQLVKPSVIHIEARKTERTRGKTESFDEAGSGVVIEIGDERWVLTNRHVIKGASANEILLRTNDGREMHPNKVLADATTDVAIMRISEPVPAARLGKSSAVDIGDFVIAIGSPFGFESQRYVWHP